MSIKFYMVVFFGLILIGQAQAYTITVKKKGDPVAIEGAIVVINQSDTYGETDENGQVKFDNTEPLIHIKILAAGYKPIIENIKDKIRYDFYLIAEEIESEGMEVIADRILEKSSKISLTSEELNNSAGSQGDPIKAISNLPGIVQASQGSGEVYMRGSGVDDNIVRVNRAPVGYLYHVGGFRSTIPPALVEDMNVFMGGFPVEYGNALGGVIDVQLRKPKNDRIHVEADISTIMSSFLVEGPVYEGSQDSFAFGGRRSYVDLIIDPETFNSDDENEDKIITLPIFYDTQFLYHQHLNKGAVDYFMFTAGDELAFELNEGATSDPQLKGELKSKTEYQTLGATWTQDWKGKLSHVINLSYSHNKAAFNIGTDESGQPYYLKSEIHNLFFQPELRLTPSVDQQYYLGFESRIFRAPIELNISRPPREDDSGFDLTTQKKYQIDETITGRRIAPYIKYRQQWSNKFASIAGLLYDDVKYDGGFHDGQLSPRLALEYQATADTLLTASWGKYLQLPSQTEVLSGYGNPSLVMTEAEHRVVGIKHQFTDIYSISFEAYHKPMSHLVVAIDDNAPPDNYLNEGEGEAYGFDLFFKRKAQGRSIGWLALSWGKTTRINLITGTERDFSGDQPLTATLVWGQSFPGSWEHWQWGIKAQAHTGQPYTKITGRHREDAMDTDSRWIPEYEENNASRYPNYYQFDLRISREVLLNESTLNLYLDLQNVFFNNNVSGYDYGNEYEYINQPIEETGMGFFPYFGVEMSF